MLSCLFARAPRSVSLFSLSALVLLAVPSLEAAPLGAWSETDTTAMHLPNTTDLGRAPSETPMDMLVSLKLKNSSVMYAQFQHMTTPGDPLYRHYMLPGEFAAMYSPSMAEAQKVIGYLTAQGFSKVTLSDNRTVVRFHGTSGMAESAFSTEIHQIVYNGKTVLANTRSASVPAALGNLVLSVTGLDTVPKMELSQRVKTRSVSPSVGVPGGLLSGYSAQNFQTIYDADPLVDASNTSIAIIAEGDLTSVLTDLPKYRTSYNLPPLTPIVIQTAITTPTDTSGADEFDLDTQTSTGIANNVKNLYIYDSLSLYDVELITEFNRYVTDDLASAASASFGGCETLEIPELSAYNQVFLQMAMQGQTLFASTGDTGAGCLNPAGNGVPAGVPGVEFPAASPYVIGVGGTTLTETAAANGDEEYDLEVAWYSGGGGTSIFQVSPAWQIPVLPTGAVTGSSTPRGVPDIAMDADPNTGANVIVSGAAEQVGGTSLASPLALGAWARMQSANNNSLGYAPPDLYQLDSGPLTAAMGFHDIIAGTNAGFAATPGWDYTTGLGSFDIKAISALLKNTPVTLPTNPTIDTGSICTLPGYLLAMNTVVGLDTPVPGHDPLSLYVAELYAPMTAEADAITFTLNVDMISQASIYLVYFSTSDGVQHYLAYEATTDGSTPFTYGTISYSTDPTGTGLASLLVFTQVGVLDPTSTADTTNNKLVFVLPKPDVPLINGTDPTTNLMTRIYGEAGTEVGFLDTGEAQEEAQYDTPQSTYLPAGNDTCEDATTTGGSTGGTSTGGTSTGGTSTGGSTTGGSSSGGTSTGGTSTGGSSSGGSSTGGTSTGGSSSGSSTGGTSTGGSSTGGSTTGGSSSGGTSTGGSSSGGSSTGGTSTGGSSSGGSSSGGTSTGGSSSGGSSTGGTSTGGSSSGGSSSGGTSTGGKSTGGTSSGGSSTGGSSSGGSSSGGTSSGGSSTGGTSTGGSSSGGGSTGGSSTGGSSSGGNSTGGTSTGGSSSGGSSTGGSSTGGSSSGGSSTGGSSTGGSSSGGGSTGGSSTGGSSSGGGSTGGASTGGSSSGGSSTGGTSTGGASSGGGSTGGSSTGGSSSGGSSTGGSSTGGSSSGGSSTGGSSTGGSSSGGSSTGGTSTGGSSSGGSSTGGASTGGSSSGGSSTGGTSTGGGSSSGGSSTGGTSTGGSSSGGGSTGGSSSGGGSSGGASTGGTTPVENPPTASLSATPTSGSAPLTVELNASASSDPNSGGSIASYTFRFGDDSPAVTQSSPTISHVYTTVGSYTASVTVTDSYGLESLNQGASQIMVGTKSAPSSSTPIASLSASPTSGTPPMTVAFDGSGSRDTGGELTVYTFDFGDGSPSVSQSTPTISHVYTAGGEYSATLTVTDSHGNSSTNDAMVSINVQQPYVMQPVTATGSSSGSGSLPPVVIGGLSLLAALRRRRRSSATSASQSKRA